MNWRDVWHAMRVAGVPPLNFRCAGCGAIGEHTFRDRNGAPICDRWPTCRRRDEARREIAAPQSATFVRGQAVTLTRENADNPVARAVFGDAVCDAVKDGGE